MKKLALIAAVLLTIKATAQTNEKKNIVKLNISTFAFKGFNLQYERQISNKLTVALGYSNIPKSNIAFASTLQDQVNSADVQIGDFKLGTSILTPELRWYVGKRGAFHGFYLAPYAKIASYAIAGPVSFNGTAGNKRIAIFDGKLNAVTGGLMVGSQFKLSKRLYFDWWILGASIGSANGNLIATTSLSPIEQSNLKQVLDDLNVPFTTINSNVNSNGATITTTGSMAGVRGLGFCVGIRF